jgi:GMP synthase (glutamine-hydrolysing)
MVKNNSILILDFGSQYTQLIARRIRELEVYSVIKPFSISTEEIMEISPSGIILSGGPMSVYDKEAPEIDAKLFNLNIPILGICYGLQLISKNFNGKVEPAENREYGKAHINVINKNSKLLAGIKNYSVVWMSHGDLVTEIPDEFVISAETDNSPVASIECEPKKIYGVQFHPEVVHTEEGVKLISNFLFNICNVEPDWKPRNYVENAIEEIREKVGDSKVILALSGGVDSSVAAVLLHNAIGEKLICVHVDNGLMRKNESRQILEMFNENFKLNLSFVDASKLFLDRLSGIENPEQKRRIIGETFIEVFESEAKKFGDIRYLAQGTLYPDVIESVPVKGASVTIKSHHNVGGLPERMNFKLLEPFRELFKDEVRLIGKYLGLPEQFIKRHPFPGPGLAVRILGEITSERLEVLREADEILIDELNRFGVYDEIWQAFTVLLPIKTVGVMGDARTYENVIAVRGVTSTDGMTAEWYHFPYKVLESISNKIIRNVKGVNRVVLDISSKPPATIEWE